MTQKKKLVEVALPLGAINEGCEQDKNRKTGHIRNIHKWFAPMPLPAWRTLLMAAVVDDPGDDRPFAEANLERQRLFRMIESVAPLDSCATASLMDEARKFVAVATNGQPPAVVDPFCGGGSTAVEAQRLGFDVIASDLNPIPVLITTALCRIPQLFRGQAPVNPSAKILRTFSGVGVAALAEDVRYYAGIVRDRAWAKLSGYYPAGPRGEQIFAWRWAWSVPSPNPAARGALTPLVTDWLLSKSTKDRAWVAPTINAGEVNYDIARLGDVPSPTAGGNSAKCLLTGDPIPFEYLREQGKRKSLRPQMFAMIGTKDGQRAYLKPDKESIGRALDSEGLDLEEVAIPAKALGFRVQAYGITNYNDLYLPRQARALQTFSDLVQEIHSDIFQDAKCAGLDEGDYRSLEDDGCGAKAYADAVSTILGLCVGRLASANNILVHWFIDPRSGGGKATPAFGMHTLSMVWDFVETNPFGDSVGGWCGPIVESALGAFKLVGKSSSTPAVVYQADARRAADLAPVGCLVATDPPYYDNIGYADLADFFYIWLRKSLRTIFPKLLNTMLTPKSPELIAAEYRHSNQEEANQYFRSGFKEVFSSLAAKAGSAFPILVIYAIKQQQGRGSNRTTGWEVFLQGLLDSGLAVVATWPLRTTTLTRARGLNSNALATAICIVCRPKLENSGKISKRDFIIELRSGLALALVELQAANIAPVDLAQAAVGRGMATYSTYEAVLESDGSSLAIGTALSLINQTLDELQSQQDGEIDADSRWALTWFEQLGFAEGEYGLAEQLSKSKNTSVAGLVDAKILASSRGKVRLLRPEDLSGTWEPSKDSRLTAWVMVHQLVRNLENQGENGAAAIVARLGSKAEIARDLCYRLYKICNDKNRTAEALAYNGLVQSWPEIIRLAREIAKPAAEQTSLF